jgi:Zn-dependent peptidase ImmA (M78 family)
MPFDIVRKALARELGHIVLGHDGTRPEDVRNQEAECFAKVLLESKIE